MDDDVEPLGVFEHRGEAARPLRRGDLHAIEGAVREPLLRVRQVQEVAAGQPDGGKEVANLVDARV